jgi:hypothetical protein
MAKLIFNLPGGLKAEREVSDTAAAKPSVPHVPAFAPDPVPEEKPQKTILEKAAEVVEEVVKPKSRRGRPKKKADAD